jgi:hypothetical protein
MVTDYQDRDLYERTKKEGILIKEEEVVSENK